MTGVAEGANAGVGPPGPSEVSEGKTIGQIVPPGSDGRSTIAEPDLQFINALSEQVGSCFKQCFQCGTCSGTCSLSPDVIGFPSQEMAWASWGLKDRLLQDPGVWLCHQCNDCSTRCPRGARPGDVLAAIREECVAHYSFPSFLVRWVNQPKFIPLLLAIPAVLFALVLNFRIEIESALGISTEVGARIVYPYSRPLPHWLLNTVFFSLAFLVLLVGVIGAVRFWRAMRVGDARQGLRAQGKGLGRSILAAARRIVTHDNFAMCSEPGLRFVPHVCVLFGFLGLFFVGMWAVTAKINPLAIGPFVYPFGFWTPWRLLANISALAVIAGCSLMIWRRVLDRKHPGANRYPDWFLLVTLLLVVLTGVVTEALHYLRLEPHRHVSYFVHLVFVFSLLVYMPYSKLAHAIYRTTAMIYAEYSGRSTVTLATVTAMPTADPPPAATDPPDAEAADENDTREPATA